MELESAKAMAIAYYESDGFELLCRDYECVDGGMGLVLANADGEMRFVDVYDCYTWLNKDTEDRVRVVAESYLREHPYEMPMEASYDVVNAVTIAGNVRFFINFKLLKLEVTDSLEKLRDDMRNYAEGWVSCIENDVVMFANRLDAIINNR